MTGKEVLEGLYSGKYQLTTASELSKMVDMQNKKKDKKELTTQEVCDELDISKSTLERRLKESTCRLVQTKKGERGSGKSTMYLRTSVDLEKRRIR